MNISVVINLDSRPGIDGCEGGVMGDGSRSWDFFIHGLENKLRFLGYYGRQEIICYIDQHLSIPTEILKGLEYTGARVVVSQHREGMKNDENYLAALRLATSEYVMHFDQDTFAKGDVEKWIAPILSGQYKFVSYPCLSSPDPDPDRERWKNFRWASTRVFFCKREDLRLDDLEKCLQDQEWAYKTFGTPPVACPWTEHYLGLMAGENQVYYPPFHPDYAIWSWGSYKAGVLAKLNQMSMPEIWKYVEQCKDINWAGELEAKAI